MKKCFEIGLLLFVWSGVAFLMDYVRQYERYFLILGLLLIIISAGLQTNRLRYIRIDLMSFLFGVFILCIFISGIYNGELSSIISCAGLFFTWFVCINSVPTGIIKFNITEERLYTLLYIMFGATFIYGLFRASISLVNYKGAFHNYNSTGEVAVAFEAVAVSSLLFHLERCDKRLNKVMFDLIVVVFCLFMAMISSSRLATLVGFLLLLFMIIFLNDVRKRNPVITGKVMTFAFLFFVLAVILYFAVFQTLIDNIIAKFVFKQNDISAGRMDLWRVALNNYKFWGNGENTEIRGVHNTYISMVNQYGLIAGVSLLLFSIIGCIRSLKLLWLNKYRKKFYFPFFVFLAFTTQSMAEAMMLKSIMLLALIVVPFLRRDVEFPERIVNAYSDTSSLSRDELIQSHLAP